jgi:hypothetical protein
MRAVIEIGSDVSYCCVCTPMVAAAKRLQSAKDSFVELLKLVLYVYSLPFLYYCRCEN